MHRLLVSRYEDGIAAFGVALVRVVGVAPALLAVMLMLLWVGSGKPALDAILVLRLNV